MGRNEDHPYWAFDESYTIENVANNIAEMFGKLLKQTQPNKLAKKTWVRSCRLLVRFRPAGSLEARVSEQLLKNHPVPSLEQSRDQYG